MNFYQECELVEKLRENRNNLVFWKTETAVEESDGIVRKKVWTVGLHYLIDNRLYEIGTDKFICESWIDEEYLNTESCGENIVVITE